MKRLVILLTVLWMSLPLGAQKYKNGVVDKTVALLGGEVILVSDIESEVQQRRASGQFSDRDVRCEVLESMM